MYIGYIRDLKIFLLKFNIYASTKIYCDNNITSLCSHFCKLKFYYYKILIFYMKPNPIE